MSDADLDHFDINNERCRMKLLSEMKAEFEGFGPQSQRRVLAAIEFILSSGTIQEYWRAVIPHELPLDEVEDKLGYLRQLYAKLAAHDPNLRALNGDVELVYGRSGIDLRL